MRRSWKQTNVTQTKHFRWRNVFLFDMCKWAGDHFGLGWTETDPLFGEDI